MEQMEITTLAHNVYDFKEALKRLTIVFGKYQKEQVSDNITIQCPIHECLSDVLHILKHLLEIYPGLQSTEILVKAHNLIKHAQSYTASEDSQQSYDFINQLASAFSVRVSEYLVGDLDINVSPHLESLLEPSSIVRASESSVSRDASLPATSHQLHQHLHVPMTTFGVELDQQLISSGTTVPFIVTNCIKEIDVRGILVKGIYRVSGVKSKVERLCQEFETNREKVQLSRVHPNIIANVLKLYLRQLPQPLLTFSLYSEFVRFAKQWPCGCSKEPVGAVDELKKIIMKLPKNYYCTVKLLMEHLKRVSDMDEINNMSPSNLGIVFGPTLLRTAIAGHSSIDSLVDTVHQSRAIELIITWSDRLFVT